MICQDHSTAGCTSDILLVAIAGTMMRVNVLALQRRLISSRSVQRSPLAAVLKKLKSSNVPSMTLSGSPVPPDEIEKMSHLLYADSARFISHTFIGNEADGELINRFKLNAALAPNASSLQQFECLSALFANWPVDAERWDAARDVPLARSVTLLLRRIRGDLHRRGGGRDALSWRQLVHLLNLLLTEKPWTTKSLLKGSHSYLGQLSRVAGQWRGLLYYALCDRIKLHHDLKEASEFDRQQTENVLSSSSPSPSTTPSISPSPGASLSDYLPLLVENLRPNAATTGAALSAAFNSFQCIRPRAHESFVELANLFARRLANLSHLALDSSEGNAVLDLLLHWHRSSDAVQLATLLHGECSMKWDSYTFRILVAAAASLNSPATAENITNFASSDVGDDNAVANSILRFVRERQRSMIVRESFEDVAFVLTHLVRVGQISAAEHQLSRALKAPHLNKSGRRPDVALFNILAGSYAQRGGAAEMEALEAVMREFNIRVDGIFWNTKLQMLMTLRRFSECDACLDQMTVGGCAPTKGTVTLLLQASLTPVVTDGKTTRNFSFAHALLSSVQSRFGVKPDVGHATQLICAYVDEQRIDEAFACIESLKLPPLSIQPTTDMLRPLLLAATNLPASKMRASFLDRINAIATEARVSLGDTFETTKFVETIVQACSRHDGNAAPFDLCNAVSTLEQMVLAQSMQLSAPATSLLVRCLATADAMHFHELHRVPASSSECRSWKLDSVVPILAQHKELTMESLNSFFADISVQDCLYVLNEQSVFAILPSDRTRLSLLSRVLSVHVASRPFDVDYNRLFGAFLKPMLRTPLWPFGLHFLHAWQSRLVYPQHEQPLSCVGWSNSFFLQAREAELKISSPDCALIDALKNTVRQLEIAESWNKKL